MRTPCLPALEGPPLGVGFQRGNERVVLLQLTNLNAVMSKAGHCT